MDAQAIRKLLEETENGVDILGNIKEEYAFSISEYLELVRDFLSDEEKAKLFDYPDVQSLKPWIRKGIITLILDENIIIQVLNNDKATSEMQGYEFREIVKSLTDNGKKQILYNENLIKRFNLSGYEIKEIILSLSEEAKVDFLKDKEFVKNRLELDNHTLSLVIASIAKEETKLELLETYELENYLKVNIISECSDEVKLEKMLTEDYFTNYDVNTILSLLEFKRLKDFFEKHKDFLDKRGIRAYQTVRYLSNEKQKEFARRIDEFNLTLTEKREILATLREDVKKDIDIEGMPEEYKSAIRAKTSEATGRIELDLNQNFENYSGLDNLISVNPEEFSEEERAKFIVLCDICPDMEVLSSMDIVMYSSRASEYKVAIEWIDSVINSLEPNYTDAQKLAVIDNAIGKRISYSADFDTEVFNESNCRAMWKIIESGYGVCNGISRVEQYLLSKVRNRK